MNREKFGSRFGALMAMVGSAVGLGNMWRFPYMVGTNGGGAFVLVYLLCMLLCLPIFLSEIIAGRRSKANAFGAYVRLAPGTHWGLAGIIAVITPMIILSYYSVVGGWSLDYLLKALSFEFNSTNPELGSMFKDLSISTWRPLIMHSAFLLLTSLIIVSGVSKGIEGFSKVMMPTLFLLVTLMAVRSATLPGASEGFRWLFTPDFGKVNVTMVLSALGQAFFSLSIGFGIMMTYASYLDSDANLFHFSTRTTIMDLVFSLIASCAIMPAVFVFGVDPTSGPGLVYETLPFIFSKMPLGNVVAIIFFLTLLVAALTSSISLYEVGVAYLVEEKKVSRKLATAIVFALTWTGGVFCSLSFGPLSDATLFGLNIFSLFDYGSSNVLIVMGSLCLVIFVGWQMKKGDVKEEFTNGGTLAANGRIFNILYFVIRWIAPVAILLIFISNFLG
ncbi:MAG: sodium-dependent transporter [Bacteroidales bacterium]|nr:sodium-dependent transporter [Bacteroidales bacterium]